MKKRMFIALDISDTDKIKLAQWREQHLPLPFKAINEKNFHITLAFLGLIDNEQQLSLAQLINQQHSFIQQYLQPFKAQNQTLFLVLSKIGYFKTAQVLHLMPTTNPDWLMPLNKLIIALCLNSQIPLENSVYQPHLSLFRKAKYPLPSGLTALQQTSVEQQLSITGFSLYHSYSTALGVCYEPVQTWKINA